MHEHDKCKVNVIFIGLERLNPKKQMFLSGQVKEQ